MNYAGIVGLFLLFFLCTIEDMKEKKIISWHLLLIIPFLIGDIIANSILTCNISWMERIIGFVIGAVFIILSKLTKGQIGMGDSYLITILGIVLGAWKGIEVIAYSFLVAAVVSIILFSFFHFGKKRTIPFVPFLFFGLIGSFILGGSSL